MNKEQDKALELQESLTYKKKSVWSDDVKWSVEDVMVFAQEYKDFLDSSKTERECHDKIVEMAKDNGFIDINDTKKSISPGDRVYLSHRGKAVALAVIGHKSLEQGFRLIGSHIDSPRLDLKPNPLYESEGLGLFKTHYYGGIKKYQWTSIPLALHGVIIKENGEKIELSIGEEDDQPIFFISDLLPHLAQEQMKKKAADVITGENLNIIAAHIPYCHDEKVKDRVKLTVLNYFYERYGLKEEDFLSAEIEIVPAYKARDVGVDRSMIAAYGQDDRVCAFTSLKAVLEVEKPQFTSVAVFMDKEEVGSMGNTGAQSRMLKNFLAQLMDATQEGFDQLKLNKCLTNGKALSADVTNAIDPDYTDVSDKLNSAYLGMGVALNKYTGSRGKSGASDAHGEFMAYIRRLLNKNGIPWQVAELGKVDHGGGGTIAQFLANEGMDVVDCGVPLLCMHAPLEISSKGDVYATYKAYKAFFIN
ncbi:MAG TPA: aminopeptidase [Clostridiales bacterium]|nr:aminopeptidase [Clostridiales bacterium]